MKILTLNLPEDFDTGLVWHNLPRDTLYTIESIDDGDLLDKEKMEGLGKLQGLAMYRAFEFRNNPDIYPDLKRRGEENENR